MEALKKKFERSLCGSLVTTGLTIFFSPVPWLVALPLACLVGSGAGVIVAGKREEKLRQQRKNYEKIAGRIPGFLEILHRASVNKELDTLTKSIEIGSSIAKLL